MQNSNMNEKKWNTVGEKLFAPGGDRTHDLWDTSVNLLD